MNAPLYDALKEAGVSDKAARAAAVAAPNGEDLATKHDIAEVRGEIREARHEAETNNAKTRETMANSLSQVGWKAAMAIVGGMTGLTAIFAVLLKVVG